MSHLSTIGAGFFSNLAIAVPTADPDFATLTNKAAFDALFASEIESAGGVKGVGTFVRVKNAREFPPMGVPPNIVNVPVYGQKTSQQIQGQADAPNLEITVNFVGTDWAAGSILGDLVGSGKAVAMRFALLNSEPDGYASDATGLGTVENTYYCWVGKVEAMTVNPQLTDANTATITLSIQSPFYGAYTV